MHSGGRSTALQCDKVANVYMPFTRCREEKVYARGLASTFEGNLNLTAGVPGTHSFDYVAFTCLYDIVHLLASVNYWFERTVLTRGLASGRFRSYSSTGIVLTSLGFRAVNEKSYWCKLHIGVHVSREVACCLRLSRS